VRRHDKRGIGARDSRDELKGRSQWRVKRQDSILRFSGTVH
jgi:hypothetical protein